MVIFSRRGSGGNDLVKSLSAWRTDEPLLSPRLLGFPQCEKRLSRRGHSMEKHRAQKTVARRWEEEEEEEGEEKEVR